MFPVSVWKISIQWILVLMLLGGGVSPGWGQTVKRDALRQRADTLMKRADSLRVERQFEPAMTRYRQALDLYRRMDVAGAAAHARMEIGVIHAYRHRYEPALAALREAVRRYRAVGDTAGAAKTLNNLAIVQRRQGAYAEARDTYRRVLSMYDALDNRSDRAVVLNNLGLVHEDLGHYRRALQRYREALAVHREFEDRAGIATSLDNLGDVLRRQGQYERALTRYWEALDLYRALDRPSRIANTLNGIATVHWDHQQYAQALRRYREVLRIYRDQDDRSSIAANLSNIGAIYREQGKYEKALETLQEALRMNRKLGDRAGVAIALNEIGVLHRRRGAYDAGLALHEKALRVHRDLDRRAGVATSLQELGRAHLAAGRYATADSVLRESIAITEALLETASGDDRRDFLAKEVDRFHQLVTARVRAGRPAAALRAFERGRSRVLVHRLAERTAEEEATAGSVPPVDSLQAGLGPEEAAVLYASTDARGPITAMIVTRDAVRAREISDSTFVEWITTRFDDALDRLRRQKGALLKEAKGLHDRDVLTNVARLYRHDLSVPPRRQIMSTARRETLSRALYGLLVQPLEDEISGAEELVIVPDGALAYLPFETLRDRQGDYLVERRQVQYSQSLRVHHLLRKRDSGSRAADKQPSLLALGGAVYEPDTYATDTASAGMSGALYASARSMDAGTLGGDTPSPAAVRTRIARTVDAGNEATRSYRQLGYGPDRWRNLGGTLRETRALGQIAGRSTLLVGERASERTIRELSRSGDLAEYRVLHFATHGFVVPQVPALSALVLSEVGKMSPSERRRQTHAGTASTVEASVDGYLNMQEISRLNLDAEFVALSACETGVGRIYRGSGSVSLAQAFLEAGARSVAVSLWSVYDASTSRFMQAVYRRAWGEETSWAAAIAETKRAFIAGDHGERLRAPRFWAPFVYYGRDEH